MPWLNSEQKSQTKILIQATKIAKNKKMRPKEEEVGRRSGQRSSVGQGKREREKKRPKREKETNERSH